MTAVVPRTAATAPAVDKDLLTTLWGELRALIGPLELAAGSPEQRRALAERLGWDLAALGTQLGVGDLATIEEQVDGWIAAVQSAVATVEDALAGGMPDSLDGVTALGKQVGAAAKALATLPQPWKNTSWPDPAMLGRMGVDVLDHLADAYLAERAPVLRRVLALLGILVPADEATPGVAEPATGAPVRLPVRRAQLHPELIGALLRDPVGTLRGLYGWTGSESAQAVADVLFPRLVALAEALGLRAWYGTKPGAAQDVGAWNGELAAHLLHLGGEVGRGAARAEWGVSVALSPDDLGGLGVVVVPHGEIALAAALGGWNLTAELGAGGAAFAVGGSGLVVDGGGTEVDLAVEVAKRPEPGEPAFRFGSATGTRLEVADFAVRAFGSFRADGEHDFGIGVHADKAELVVSAGGDGFLDKVLPADGIRVALAAGLAWSRRGGLSISGGAGLSAELPARVELGPVVVDGVKVALVAADTGVSAQATADVHFELGPVLGVIDDIGVRAALTFPAGGGNLGPADVSVEPVFPTGISMRVQSGVVNGAGFLAVDRANGRYAGGVDLEFAKLRLAAVGLLTTKMPDGRKGFSLLVLVNARFPKPLPLGFGFNLASVGGLLGINRSVDLARMRAGLRSGALAALLSPGEAMGRDATLLSGLESLFPVTPGRFVFGPTARITWGSPTIVTADLGLALELPNPVRLMIAGRVKVALPDERAPAVLLNLDALGVLDFGAGTLSVDASLYDSKVAGLPLSGDMALRAKWSGGGDFALSVGGFHPRFTPPPAFPQLRPMALTVGSGGAVRAELAAYLALTTNTLQLGARADIVAKAGKLTAEGHFSFDSLVRFSPFGFEVDLGVIVVVRWGGKTLLGITADVFLSGPGTWHVRGKATVKVLFLSASVRFDSTFGSSKALPPTPGQDVAALVRAALADPGAWVVEDRGTGPAALTARPGATSSGMLVSPAARIVVRQKLAPLGGTLLDRFGQAPVVGDRSVTIESARLGGRDASTTTVRDPFAPGQFRAMSDEEKLTHAAFDLMPSGVAFSATDAIVFDTAAPAPVAIGYVTRLIDAPDAPAAAALRRAAGEVHASLANGIVAGDMPGKPLPGKPIPGKPLPDPNPGPVPPDRPGKPLPIPDPIPDPEPDPKPDPEPDPRPDPEPTPDPEPDPDPDPQPDPDPTPDPDPQPDPDPTPDPDPVLDPTPDPEPIEPAPVVVPDPEPQPQPEPEPDPAPPVADWVLDGALLSVLATAGAAGRAPVREAGTERFTGAAELPVRVEPESFLLVSATRLTPAGPQPADGETWSRAEAVDQLRRYTEGRPANPQPLMVLSAAEVPGSTR